MKFLRLPAVQALLGNIAESTLRDHIREGIFPPPVKHRGISFWLAEEIDQVQAAVSVGYSDESVKALVKRIVAERTGRYSKYLEDAS